MSEGWADYLKKQSHMDKRHSYLSRVPVPCSNKYGINCFGIDFNFGHGFQTDNKEGPGTREIINTTAYKIRPL